MNLAKRAVILLLWLCLVSACGWADAVTSPPSRYGPLPEDKPAYRMEQVRSGLQEVLPLVERLAGRKLHPISPIRLVTRQQFVDAITKQAQPRSGRASGGQSRAADDSASRYAAYAFGSFDRPTETLYLLPGNFRPRLCRAGVSPDHYHVILLMVIAHELTHALQEQEVGLSTIEKAAGPAARYLIEGHAKFIMDRVAEALGAKQAIGEFEKTISVGLAPPRYQRGGSSDASFRDEERRVYIDGGRFFEWHEQRGGSDRIWQILKDPPSKVSVILHPETYSPPQPDNNRPGSRTLPSDLNMNRDQQLARCLIIERCRGAEGDDPQHGGRSAGIA